jgi:DNA adenine methylase
LQVLNVAGAKARLAPWIISHFPPHQLYCEPFGGSAAVLLAKERSELEVYNDLNRDLVLFFQTLVSNPEELLRAIDGCLYSSVIDGTPTENRVELARRFFQHNNTTWSFSSTFKTQKRVGDQKRTLLDKFEERKKYLHVVADRIRNVIFENQDAIKLIQKYDGPNVLFYVDRKANLYKHEMMDEASHRRLAEVLKACQGTVILSGNGSALYSELYADWKVNVGRGQSTAQDLRKECLWIKPSQNEVISIIGLSKNRRCSDQVNVMKAADCIFTGRRTKREEHRPRKLKYQKILWKALQDNPDGICWTEILHKVKIPSTTLIAYLRRWTKEGHIAKDKNTDLWRVLSTSVRPTAKVYLTVADRARMNGISRDSQTRLDQIARIWPELLVEIRKGELSIKAAYRLCDPTKSSGALCYLRHGWKIATDEEREIFLQDIAAAHLNSGNSHLAPTP